MYSMVGARSRRPKPPPLASATTPTTSNSSGGVLGIRKRLPTTSVPPNCRRAADSFMTATRGALALSLQVKPRPRRSVIPMVWK